MSIFKDSKIGKVSRYGPEGSTAIIETTRLHSLIIPKMIEVFKTNVEEVSDANKIVIMLLQHIPDSMINFDLEDCDKVLRIEGKNFIPQKVMTIVKKTGFMCDVLD